MTRSLRTSELSGKIGFSIKPSNIFTLEYLRIYVENSSVVKRPNTGHLEMGKVKERLARVGLTVLMNKSMGDHIKKEVRFNTSEAFIQAMTFYKMAGAYENMDKVCTMFDGIDWFGEQEALSMKILGLRVQLHKKKYEFVQIVAKECLDYARQRGWKVQKSMCSRLLSTVLGIA